MQKNSQKQAPTGHSKLTKEIQYLKNKMKEHFKFFDNHSP